MNMRDWGMQRFAIIVAVFLPLLLTGCPNPPGWPIARDVFTTTQQQIHPGGLPADTPPVNPADVPLYEVFGYSAWQIGAGSNYSTTPGVAQPYDKRTDLAPDYAGAPNAAKLLSFFCITDIHITDKESPAQPIYPGWSAKYGPTAPTILNSSYSPIILSTTHVLDAAVQTVNALHEIDPFDFGISLGDNINNTQYNELRWFIDVLDGKVITPSSGAHAGASTIDYQMPYKAEGLNREIPWYQVIGNHDQYWSGIAYETEKSRRAHRGNTVLNVDKDCLNPNFSMDSTGYYMGVVDGTTPYGSIVGAGPQENFDAPPRVVPDLNRRSLSTPNSTSLSWMREFFSTSSEPAGHGFSQSNLDNDFACYSFEPLANIPIKIIALDNTNKPSDTLTGVQYVGFGGLDPERLDWLKDELQAGQDADQLMIIAAHIPIKAQANLTDQEPVYSFYDHAFEDALLATLHNYPNLIMWIAGHRHLNTVTAQSYDPSIEGQGPENSFWEVETASLRDFPQQLRTFDIRRNSDNTISIFVTCVDPAVKEGSPAWKSRGYAVGAERIFGATDDSLADTSSEVYNAELVKQLTPAMQNRIAHCGWPIR